MGFKEGSREDSVTEHRKHFLPNQTLINLEITFVSLRQRLLQTLLPVILKKKSRHYYTRNLLCHYMLVIYFCYFYPTFL